jgi:glyoxylase-like metal-dependent hydrolase (beta-lactamase superfamily II)/8-oxo-dGTP pyrophosphatase MutT (NUDIX family)
MRSAASRASPRDLRYTRAMIPAPRDASAVVLLRRLDDSPEDLEVFWVRRSPTTSYLGGFHTVPGGRVDPSDANVSVEGAANAGAARLYAAAVRELFEESGVLLARGTERLASETHRAERRALLAGETTLAEVLARHDLRIRADAFEDAGRWVTPPFSSIRFDTRFFLAWLPAGQEAEVWNGELVFGEWIRPADAYERWRRGDALLTPPTLHILSVLAGREPFDARAKVSPASAAETQAVPQERPLSLRPDAQAPPRTHTLPARTTTARPARATRARIAVDPDAPLAALAARLRSVPEVQRGPTRKIELRPGIFLVPLETPTLPPATHTNCYIVGGKEIIVVDPGSPYENEQHVLDEFLARLLEEGRTVRAILLTHHHRDHWGGAEHLRARFNVPIFADRRTAEQTPATEILNDGEVIPLAAFGDTPERRLRAVHTPGHTRGHLCFLEETTGTLLAGDLVAGMGTVIIDPPEGDMQAYLASLRKLLDLPLTALLPGHGAPTGGAAERLHEYIAHRTMREKRIVQAIASGANDVAEIVAAAYTDTAPSLHPLAERSTLAHLEKLVAEGRVAKRPDGTFELAAVKT